MSAYAECYTTAAADQTLETADTWEALAATFTAGLYGNTIEPTSAGVIAVMPQHIGRYQVDYEVVLKVRHPSTVFEGMTHATEDIEVSVNVSDVLNSQLVRPCSSDTTLGSLTASGSAFLNLASGDEVQIVLRSTSNDGVGVTIQRAHLRVKKIG